MSIRDPKDRLCRRVSFLSIDVEMKPFFTKIVFNHLDIVILYSIPADVERGKCGIQTGNFLD